MKVSDEIVQFMFDEIRSQPIPPPPRVSELGIRQALNDDREDVRILAELIARRRRILSN